MSDVNPAYLPVIDDGFLNDESPIVRELFLKYRSMLYKRLRFTMPLSPIHAMHHCERVLLHALALVDKEMPGDIDALHAIALASVFHDSRRFDDYMDTGHGARAAVYYSEFCSANQDIPYCEDATYAMRYHDLPDERGVHAIREHFGDNSAAAEKIYACFKDADALDRFRLGPDGLDPRFLRTQTSTQRIEKARELVKATVDSTVLNHTTTLVDEIMALADEERRLLLIVDPQVDFITGSLKVKGAEKAMDALAEFIRNNPWRYSAIVITGDKHPYGHISFLDWGGEWPRHCVADTVGAAFWPPLVEVANTAGAASVHTIHKGCSHERDEYSALQSRHNREIFAKVLRQSGATIVDICGLAGDVCVLSTLRDGLEYFPDTEFCILPQFSPSIDGGEALESFIKEKSLKSYATDN